MMKLNIITNKEKGHLNFLREVFNNSDEIRIAVAFVSKDGIHKLFQDISNYRSLKILCGINGEITDVHELKKFVDNSNEKVQCKIYTGENLFHPKMYIGIKENKTQIIIGSANLTLNGLVNNEEVSFCSEIEITDTNSDPFNTYFNNIWENEAICVNDFLAICPDYKTADINIAEKKLTGNLYSKLQKIKSNKLEQLYKMIKFDRNISETLKEEGRITFPPKLNEELKKSINESKEFEISFASKIFKGKIDVGNNGREYCQFRMYKKDLPYLQDYLADKEKITVSVDLSAKIIQI